MAGQRDDNMMKCNSFFVSQASHESTMKKRFASLGGSVIPRTLWRSAVSKLRGPSP